MILHAFHGPRGEKKDNFSEIYKEFEAQEVFIFTSQNKYIFLGTRGEA